MLGSDSTLFLSLKRVTVTLGIHSYWDFAKGQHYVQIRLTGPPDTQLGTSHGQFTEVFSPR